MQHHHPQNRKGAHAVDDRLLMRRAVGQVIPVLRSLNAEANSGAADLPTSLDCMRGSGFDARGKRQTEGSGTHQRWPISDHGRVQWFTLVDQATTGRWFEKYNGEAANTGITVTDRP